MGHSLRGRNVIVSPLGWAAYLHVCLYLLWEQVCYVCHHRAVQCATTGTPTTVQQFVALIKTPSVCGDNTTFHAERWPCGIETVTSSYDVLKIRGQELPDTVSCVITSFVNAN